MDNEIIEIPFGISANGVYRSVRYLLGIDIYADETNAVIIKGIVAVYSFKAIAQITGTNKSIDKYLKTILNAFNTLIKFIFSLV